MNKKALSLPLLTSLEIGNMIGTGIYILPAALASFGIISLFSWIYTAIGALLIAITFTHLNKRFPKTGGPYVYSKEAFGPFIGFLIGCTYWFVNLASLAGVIVASVGYLGYLDPSLDANSPTYQSHTVLNVELGLLWFFTIINIIGLHTAGIAQFILTVLKVMPLIIIGLLGIKHIDMNHFATTSIMRFDNFSAIGAAATLTFWAFIGIEAATVPAESTAGYKDIFKATIYGTIITSIIYIFVSFVLMGMIPSSQLANSQFPFAEAGKLIFGSYGAAIVVICAFISGIGTLNACILLQSQVMFAVARDKLLPKIFAKLTKNDSPVAAQLLGSIIVTIALIFTMAPTMLKQFDTIAMIASLLAMTTYIVTMCAELKFLFLAHRKISRVIFSFSGITTMLATAYTIWMLTCFQKEIVLMTSILITACIFIYFFLVRKWSARAD